MNNLIVASLFATLGALVTVQEIPLEFWPGNPDAAGPVWIQVSEVVSPEGTLIEDRLAPVDAIKIKYFLSTRTRQQEVGPCDVALGALIDDSATQPPVQSMAEVKARAQRGRAIAGTITATAVGFYSGSPFTVLQVSPEKGPHPFYLLYPRATIEVNGKRICTTDTRYVAQPKIHDEVIAVVEEAIDDHERLYRVQPELLFFADDGDTVLSGHLRGLRPTPAHRFDILKSELLAIRNDRGPER